MTSTPTATPPGTLQLGDANCDGRRSAADLTAYGLLIGAGDRAPCGLDDLNGDGIADGSDVDAAIRVLFGAGECGGFAGIPCPDGNFCEHPAGTCNAADQSGACQEIPIICALDVIPVCGCNGTTYTNDCLRRNASVSKDHDGDCTAPSPSQRKRSRQ